MDSTTVDSGEIAGHDRVVCEPIVPKRRRFPKFLSASLIALLALAIKLKDFTFFIIERGRLLFVNPFEGFGATQYAIAGGSIVVTIAAGIWQTHRVGIVVGFVVLTVIHEIGHAVVIRAKGLRAGFLVFIPFIGGAVTLKDQPRSAYDDAQIGLAGPCFGTAASLITLQIYKWTGDPLYLTIALIGFALNLLNLIPLGMLDGGRISGAITKWMWVLGGGGLIYKTIKQPNPLLIVILLLSAFQVYAAIVREQDDKAFYDVTLGQRFAIACAYFALTLFLGHQTYLALNRLAALAPR
jgi:Zn-dependent protease